MKFLLRAVSLHILLSDAAYFGGDEITIYESDEHINNTNSNKNINLDVRNSNNDNQTLIEYENNIYEQLYTENSNFYSSDTELTDIPVKTSKNIFYSIKNQIIIFFNYFKSFFSLNGQIDLISIFFVCLASLLLIIIFILTFYFIINL